MTARELLLQDLRLLLTGERAIAAEQAVANGSQWEDRSQGIVAGLDIALAIVNTALASEVGRG